MYRVRMFCFFVFNIATSIIQLASGFYRPNQNWGGVSSPSPSPPPTYILEYNAKQESMRTSYMASLLILDTLW